jgi:hypothetical protein
MSAPTILICTPVYSSVIHVECMLSVMRTMSLLQASGISVGFTTRSGVSHIDLARNILVAEFMRSEAQYLLFVDSDLSFAAEDILTLLKLDRPIVGIPCPTKTLDWDRIRDAALDGAAEAELARWGTKLTYFTPQTSNDDGTVQCEAVGTGLTLIRRDVFEKLERAHPETRHTHPFAPNEQIFAHYDAGVIDGMWRAEDMMFCYRAAAVGIPIAAYPRAARNVVHYGSFAYVASPILREIEAKS